MDLKLLLPRVQTTIKFDRFLVQLPIFKQVWGTLPGVFFERLKIDGSGSSVTVGVCLPVSWHEPHETHTNLSSLYPRELSGFRHPMPQSQGISVPLKEFTWTQLMGRRNSSSSAYLSADSTPPALCLLMCRCVTIRSQRSTPNSWWRPGTGIIVAADVTNHRWLTLFSRQAHPRERQHCRRR